MTFDPKILSGTYVSGLKWWGFDLALPDDARHRKRFSTERAAQVHRLWLLKTYGDGTGMSAKELLDCQSALYVLKAAGNTLPMTEVVGFFLRTYKTVPTEKTLAEYAALYQARKKAKRKSPKTLKEIEVYLKPFLASFGHMKPSEVGWEAIDLYLKGETSRWHRDKVLRPFLAWLAGSDHSLAVLPDFPLKLSPFAHIEHPQPEAKKPTVILFINEVKALIRGAIGTDQLAWIVWGLFSGPRPEAEARHMWRNPSFAWTQIDLARRTVVVTSSKLGGKTHETILQPSLITWLRYFRKHGLVPRYSRRHFRSVKDATVPAKADVQDILRHTSISNMVKLVKPDGNPMYTLSDVAAQCGTSVAMIQANYLAQISEQADVDEFWSLTPASFDLH